MERENGLWRERMDDGERWKERMVDGLESEDG